MKLKASSSPVPDGVIMYCAESSRGYGGFTSLAVRNGRLEFRFDLGDGMWITSVAASTIDSPILPARNKIPHGMIQLNKKNYNFETFC